MNTLELNGANINYNIEGKGPLLILIPGANGTGDIFEPFVEQLKHQFSVVTYDRRGYGKSNFTEPLPERTKNAYDDYRIKRDVKDIVELSKYLADESIYVLGTSSGAIVAMHLLKDYPEIINKIAFHEPPINTFLPDATYWKEKNEDIVDDIFNKGLEEGMKTFSKKNNTSSEDMETASQFNVKDSEAQKQKYEQTLFWAKYEIRQYTHSDITLEDLAKNKSLITLLSGAESKDTFVDEVNNYISEQLNINVMRTPGGHFGYMHSPKEFSETLYSFTK